MGENMSQDRQQGNDRSRGTEPFDREIAGIYASWKSQQRTSRSDGSYASRAIANVAQRIQWPASAIDRHLQDAANAEVPLEKMEALGRAFIRRAQELHAQRDQRGQRSA